ncbi:MAG: hypothetical protein ACYTDU_07175 [Planctomycetota bacterium]|jgi:hypothetical protein
MKTAALLVSVLAIAGLWIWAVSTQVEPEPLPERLCGTFQAYRFEPPEGVFMASPLQPHQRYRYTFRADGTYRLSILVTGGYEMLRSEGLAVLDRKQVLSLRQLSLNRYESPTEPERFGTWWGQDEEGAFLRLRHVGDGHSLYLRRVKEEQTKPG